LFFVYFLLWIFQTSNRPQSFSHVSFSGNRRTREEEVNGERHEEKDKAHHAGQELAMWWGHFFLPWLQSVEAGIGARKRDKISS
jgi:hypothetical protein